MLLSSSMSLLAQSIDSSPSTGSELHSDSSVAVIPVSLIKSANAKMIERLYLIDINKQQDSIILMKNDYIKEQQKIITDFQHKVDDSNKVNEVLTKKLDKQHKRNKIAAYGVGSVIAGLIIGIIVK